MLNSDCNAMQTSWGLSPMEHNNGTYFVSKYALVLVVVSLRPAIMAPQDKLGKLLPKSDLNIGC